MRIDRNEIAPKLEVLKAAVAPSREEQVAQGVLVSGDTMWTSNMELQVSTKMSFTAEEDFILPPKAIDLICNMGPGEIDITVDKGSVSVSSGSIRTKLQTFELEQFVRIDEPEKNTRQFTIAADKLMQAISRVIYAVGKNSNKPALTGILFDCESGVMTIAACDGYRMAKVCIPYDATFHFILPEPTAKCLMALGLSGDVEIVGDRQKAIFRTAEYTIVTRLISGEFIDVKKVFSAEPRFKAKFEKSDLLSVIRRSQIVMDNKILIPLLLTFSGEECSFSQNSVIANFNETVSFKCDTPISEPVEIAFDHKKLLDFVKSVPDDTVPIGIIGGLAPAMMEYENYSAILLPVQIKKKQEAPANEE